LVELPSDALRPGALLPPSHLAENLFLLATLALHDLDHVRQGREIEPGVVAIGILGDVVTIVSLVLAMMGSTLAPAAATLVGFGTAVGFVAVHVVPDWGPVSQGYPGTPVDGLSWIAAIVPIIPAVALGLTGLNSMRARRAARPGWVEQGSV
jgi:hypothetical protein